MRYALSNLFKHKVSEYGIVLITVRSKSYVIEKYSVVSGLVMAKGSILDLSRKGGLLVFIFFLHLVYFSPYLPLFLSFLYSATHFSLFLYFYG